MTAQGSPRLSLEGLRFRRVPQDASLGRSPQICLQLSKRDYPAEGLDAFSPLRLPENVEALLRDVDAALLQDASGSCELHLAAGTYELPVAGREPFVVRVLEGTVAGARFELGPADPIERGSSLLSRVLAAATPEPPADGVMARVVRSIEISFSQPLVLPNVFRTLVEFQELFSDKGLAGVVQSSIAAAQDMALASRFAALADTMADSADQFGDIHLRHVHAAAEYRARTGRWELRMRFSGHVHMAGRIPVAFRDLLLPSFILPVPFATLDDLLSPNPLATANLHSEHVRFVEIAARLLEMVGTFRGEARARAQLPQLGIAAQGVDRTNIELTASVPGFLELSGSFEGQVVDGAMLARSDDIRVGFPDPSVHLAVQARVDAQGAANTPLLSRLRVDLELGVHAGSTIPRLRLEVNTDHPFATGSMHAAVDVRALRIHEGAGGLSLASRTIELWPMTRRVAFSCDACTPSPAAIGQTGLQTEAWFDQGHLDGTIELGPDAVWRLGVSGSASTRMRVTKDVPDIPELSIEAGALVGRIEADASFDIEANADFLPTNAFSVELRQGRLSAAIRVADLMLHDRRIAFPEGMAASIESHRGSVTASGFDKLAFDLAWDMHGLPCLLHVGERSASLLAEDLRSGEVTVHIGSEGRLSFSGEREGLYGIRYFNALLNPLADPAHMLEILRSEEALNHVFSAFELLSPKLADKLLLLRDIVLGVRTIAQRAGVRELRHFIPREAMARLMSLVLAGNESETQRLATLIRAVTEARGLDVIEVKNILRSHFDPFDADYEIAGIVRWFDRLLSPIGPCPPEPAQALEPLATQFADNLSDLPSASEIYSAVFGGQVTPAFAATLCRIAVLLREEQLAFILAHTKPSWGAKRVQWLRYVHAVKRRINRIAQAYGGIEHALQGLMISLFLGEAVSSDIDPMQLPDSAWEHSSSWPPACALGPQEVATLLKAGLGLDRQVRQTQINNRMIIDLLAQRDDEFMLQVFAELGQDNPNALSGILFAFLDQEQDHMQAPVDLPELLESKLTVQVPRRRDYMAGGRRASQSYYEALAELADVIVAKADPHVARKTHVQVQRTRPAPPWRQRARSREAVEAARDAIAKADRVAAQCSFGPRAAGRTRDQAAARYRDAFARCSALLQTEPLAFQAPWFKSFWCRNEEALRVLSVVRNYQENVDRVRHWLHVRSGCSHLASEQQLIEAVVRTLIFAPEDQRQLLADPLVRLLIDPEPGPYDFAVVSCMGVITEGESGTELQDAYRRLFERRAIRVLRAPTGTAMSLEENARRIISIIRLIQGPFGTIGYSQGCANALAAESMLRGGTPSEQRLLDKLVSRNLLFSSFNGSAHGTFGSIKFLQSIIEGERVLKHYQVKLSSEAVGAFLRVVKALLDSSLFVRVLAGVYSLTPSRARAFHREIQVVDHAPTSTSRGVIDEGGLPEALELTYYLLRNMAPGAEQDTQVLAPDALGTSTRVINEMTQLLGRCDMPSMRQTIHHWSPLVKETQFVTTERDHQRAVYDSPKDRHVFPWIEVNARFGLIRRAATALGHH